MADVITYSAEEDYWTLFEVKSTNFVKKEHIFTDLIEYCKLDTLAMVEIYKALVNVTKEKESWI